MCGITGFVAFNAGIEAKYVKAMNDQIKHRGPDDEGYYILDADDVELVLGGVDTKYTLDGLAYLPKETINNYANSKVKLAFGHRRLSILDLSTLGHQPMSMDNGNYWITYNGEVYNYIEIKQELEDLGYRFISNTDTEVILTAYKEWGKECLSKFNGMFALIIYDKTKNQLFVARDRFGVKPLYYFYDRVGIYFASEIKQFTVLPDWQAKLNHKSAYDFLVHGVTDHTNETLFKEVLQLRGGEFLTINLAELKPDNINPARWYDLVPVDYLKSYGQACTDFKNLFLNAVEIRLRAEVKVGSCLSGGLDSSAIVCVINEILTSEQEQCQQTVFSACSQHKQFNEREYIDIVVEKTDSTPYYCYPEWDNLFNINETLTWYQDEPFGSTSVYAQWSVFELAKNKGVSVMLDGQGADEQLAGYQSLYFQTYLNGLLHSGKLIKFGTELKLFNKLHKYNMMSAIVRSLLSFFPINFIVKLGKCLGRKTYNTNWISDKLLSKNKLVKIDLINKNVKSVSYTQLMQSNLPMLLHFEDRNSMAHSIESRVPFIDYRLVELIYSMPTQYKINNGVTKRVLRDGLSGILPDKIKNRMSKLGFATPEEIWLRSQPEIFRNKLLQSIEYSKGILNKEQVLILFDEIVSGKTKFDFWIWRVINFGTWMKVYNIQL